MKWSTLTSQFKQKYQNIILDYLDMKWEYHTQELIECGESYNQRKCVILNVLMVTLRKGNKKRIILTLVIYFT